MTAVATGLIIEAGAEADAPFCAGRVPGREVPGLHRTAPGSPLRRVDFTQAGSRCRAPSMGWPTRHEQSVSIVTYIRDQADGDRIRDGHPAAGGMPVQCGWPGTPIACPGGSGPRDLTDPVFGGTAEEDSRATAARLKQIKIDLAAVQAAFEGVEP